MKTNRRKLHLTVRYLDKKHEVRSVTYDIGYVPSKPNGMAVPVPRVGPIVGLSIAQSGVDGSNCLD